MTHRHHYHTLTPPSSGSTYIHPHLLGSAESGPALVELLHHLAFEEAHGLQLALVHDDAKLEREYFLLRVPLGPESLGLQEDGLGQFGLLLLQLYLQRFLPFGMQGTSFLLQYSDGVDPF